jgi:Ferritin-like domain
MAANRIMFFLAAAATLVIAGCGGGGGGSTSVQAERETDAKIVDAALARELTAINDYTAAIPHLRGAAARALARKLRAQEQEHVDGLTKVLRGLAAPVEVEPEEADLGEAKTPAELLGYLYERERSLVANHLREMAALSLSWPRVLLGSIIANEAQHLTLLRQALGVGLAGSIPRAFESGTDPVPGG